MAQKGKGHFITMKGRAVWVPGPRPTGSKVTGKPKGLGVTTGVGTGAALSGAVLAVALKKPKIAKGLFKTSGRSFTKGSITPFKPGVGIRGAVFAKQATEKAKKTVGIPTTSVKMFRRNTYIKNSQQAFKELGITKDATFKEAQSKYIKMVRSYHPDVAGTKASSEKTQRINEAFDSIKPILQKQKIKTSPKRFVKKAEEEVIALGA